MKVTNIKNSCCSRIIKYFCAPQKSLLLFCAAHRNKQKYFDAFALLWDDTKSTNCPGGAGFTKARYMKSFSFFLGPFLIQPIILFLFVLIFLLTDWHWLENAVGRSWAGQICPFLAKNSV
jgi:hypothetical protein